MKIFPVGSKEKQQKITNLQRDLSGRGEFQGPQIYLSPSARSSGKDQYNV